MNSYLLTPRLAGRLVLLLVFAFMAMIGRAQHDLSIFRVSSDVFVQQGDIVSFTFVVTNDLGTDVTGVNVQIDLPAGLDYLQHSLSQNFDPATGVWDIGSIAYYQPQRVITIDARVSGEGVLTANAEISAMDGTDSDSTPANGDVTEDDIVSACVSIPIRAECGQSVKLEAPSGYTGYQWYRDGVLIPGATGAELNVGETGQYNFVIGNVTTTCPLGSCCPAIVSFDSISVQLSQPTVCTGGFDTVYVDMPEVDQVNFTQVYTWSSPDDMLLNFLSCTDCSEPKIFIDQPYLNDSIRYVVGVVTRDLAGNIVCRANATLVIEVLQAPLVTFNTPVYACAEEQVPISITTDLATTSVLWDGPNLITPDGYNMVYRPRAVADYKTETFIVTATGLDGCIRVDSTQIITMPSFDLVAEASQTICQFEVAELSVSTTPLVALDSLVFTWSELPGNPNVNANLSSTSGSDVSTNALDPGVYGFRVSVQRRAPNGDLVCAYETDITVTVQSDCAQPRLGGFAWKDANGDGLRQNFETPMEGIQAELFTSAGLTTGLFATSDATGFYEFSNLPVGDYAIQFQALPAFVFAPQNQGTDEFIDSDADGTGRSDIFSATYDEALHVVGVGYVADCQLAFVNVATTPGECGDPNGSLSFDVFGASGNLTYTWSPDVSTTNSATGLVSGTYSITVYDDITECSNTETLTVPGSSNFLLTTSSSPAACPLGKGGSITVFTDGGNPPFTVDYVGTDNGQLAANAMPFTIQDIRGGEYTVSVTDASGCTQFSAIYVGENTLTLSIDTSNVILAGCNGANIGSFDVTIGGFFQTYSLQLNGLSIAANTAQSTITLSNQSAGFKSLEVIDANGCVQVFGFELRDGSSPIDLATLNIQDVNCFGEATGSISSSLGYEYEVRNSAGVLIGTLPQNNLVADEYTLIDRSIPGCLSTASIFIEQPEELLVNVVAIGSDCDIDNGSITLTLTGGLEPYNYVWNNGLPNSAIQTNLAAGAYQVIITDLNGCRIDTTINVIDICEPLTCSPLFTADTLVISTDNSSYDWCFANFDIASDRVFAVNGSSITPSVCVRSGLIYYNLEALPGDGADGPYIIEFWYGGDNIVIAETLTDAEAFARALDAADSWGRWIYDADENTVRGGQPDRAYGELEVTHIGSGQRVYLTPQVLYNQLSTTFTFNAPGSYTVSTIDLGTGCLDSIHLILQPIDYCADAFVPSSTTISTPYCDQDAPVCLKLPYELMLTSTLEIDGNLYTGPIEPCAKDEIVYYDLTGLNLDGIIFLDYWTVDGRFESSRASSLDELAARMKAFDTENWIYDSALNVLRGGSKARAYGDLTLRANGVTSTLSPLEDLYDGSRILLATGSHRAEVTYADGCSEVFSITIGCSTGAPPSVDTINVEIGVGFSDTLCLSTNELSGLLDLVENICEDQSGELSVITSLDSTCFRIEGLELGQETLCIVACDESGVCDTTIVIIDILDPRELLYPIANADIDSLSMNGSKAISILSNDQVKGDLVSLEVIQYPIYGDARIENGELIYDVDAGFCGIDNIVYELCNQHGCDTALVTINVLCDELIIYSGFSPNYDDVNQYFTVLGVEQFPGNKMEVFNRQGNLVFEMEDYNNSWEGTYFDGEELPEGTYFYVFEDGKGRTYTGYVYLKR